MKKIAIIGASGHGKVVADIAKLNGYQEIIFLDDNESLTECGSYPVKGTSRDVVIYAKEGYDFFVGIGNPAIRERIQNSIEDKVNIVTLIHPSAVIAEDVTVGPGSVAMAGAVVNSGTVLGKSVIVNTGATVDHDNSIGDYVHVAVAAHTTGTVTVGARSWIGAGAIVINNIEVCSDCMIGAGAVVVKSISEKGTYVGVPAKKIK